MPNWTTNTITVENADVLKRFISINDEGREVFDFNKAIPRPKPLDVEHGSDIVVSVVCYMSNKGEKSLTYKDVKEYIWKEYFAEAKFKESFARMNDPINSDKIDKWYEDGKQYVFNVDNYGFLTWYGWSLENWGTKWNACDNSFSDDHCEVTFLTAWSAPVKVFEKMCEMFPDEVIEFECEDEDGENVTLFENRNGRLV